jgi:hypothetical protein
VNTDRFLRHPAHTAPAVVLQASDANGVGIARDLGVRGAPCACLDPEAAFLAAGEAAAAWRNGLSEPAPDGTPAALRRRDG